METPLISKRQFNKFRKHFPPRHGRPRKDDRTVPSGIIWVIKYGCPWRHVPEFYGKWTTIYSRFKRWSKQGIFHRILHFLSKKLKKKCIAMIESTFAKAHRTASSLAFDGQARELGKSHGGITSKIHLLCNNESKPIDFIITGGQVHDIKIAPKLVSRNKMKYLVADKAYGSKSFRAQLHGQRIKDCISPKSNEKDPAQYDKKLYEQRHIIENMFAKIKDWKGIAFRSNGCAYTYKSFVAITLVSIFFNAYRP